MTTPTVEEQDKALLDCICLSIIACYLHAHEAGIDIETLAQTPPRLFLVGHSGDMAMMEIRLDGRMAAWSPPGRLFPLPQRLEKRIKPALVGMHDAWCEATRAAMARPQRKPRVQLSARQAASTSE